MLSLSPRDGWGLGHLTRSMSFGFARDRETSRQHPPGAQVRVISGLSPGMAPCIQDSSVGLRNAFTGVGLAPSQLWATIPQGRGGYKVRGLKGLQGRG